MLDRLGVQCDAPAGVATYNGLDVGTPDAANSPPDCSGSAEGQCFDVGLGTLRPIVQPSVGELSISEWMPDPTLVGDTSGEWFEVAASAAFDLNGLQAGTTTLSTTPVVPASGDCVHVEPGDFALLARSADPGINGGLPAVDGVFGFSLLNSNGSLRIGVASQILDVKTWVTATAARSIQIDSDGSQCPAPVGTPSYNGTDVGTPRQPHSVECPQQAAE